jgi:hypothetical protein
MRDGNFPTPISDPEADRLPGVADDDSTAWDDVESGGIAEGPDPGMLPVGRDDRPFAVDQNGNAPETARIGQSLDLKRGPGAPDCAWCGTGDRADATPSPVPVESIVADARGTDLGAVDRDTALDVARCSPTPARRSRFTTPVSVVLTASCGDSSSPTGYR